MLHTLDISKQTMNSVRSSNLSLKYHRFTTSTSKDIEVYIFDFVPKTQFLLNGILVLVATIKKIFLHKKALIFL